MELEKLMYHALTEIGNCEAFFDEEKKMRNTARRAIQKADQFKEKDQMDRALITQYKACLEIANSDSIYPNGEKMIMIARQALEQVDASLK